MEPSEDRPSAARPPNAPTPAGPPVPHHVWMRRRVRGQGPYPEDLRAVVGDHLHRGMTGRHQRRPAEICCGRRPGPPPVEQPGDETAASRTRGNRLLVDNHPRRERTVAKLDRPELPGTQRHVALRGERELPTSHHPIVRAATHGRHGGLSSPSRMVPSVAKKRWDRPRSWVSLLSSGRTSSWPVARRSMQSSTDDGWPSISE